MGYDFRGIVTSFDAMKRLKEKYTSTKIIPFYNELIVIPLTDELYDEINMNQGTTMPNYEYLTDTISYYCIEISKFGLVAYIEAEYFGGTGSQNAMVWDSSQVIFEETLSQSAINRSLEILGVCKLQGKDEFDTVGLGRHRDIEDWE
ncbi:hypothetical protein MH215_19135 [Paenibacillus sp. ACRSA]|uniref:hypothetical protein n=1 Tax=Paenibacillus sp. ACRSA TaxID=2918211 RepID=UPI001EF4AA8D|nr:hypothetical protein [Paenibacillus sp. ACRSA]MCG7379133.1 hypothetical protein [Paenibacillus sp. ACRSA]